MKPTQQQIQQLKDYLNTTLNYRETYEEVYDHILTAMNDQPDTLTFEEKVNNVICTDFGGHKNFADLEKKVKEALAKETYNRFLANCYSCVKFPRVIYTLIGGAFTYLILSTIGVSPMMVEAMLAVTALLPGVIVLMRLYQTGYIFGTKKSSAKEKAFGRIAGLPTRLFVMVNILFPLLDDDRGKLWRNLQPYTVTIIIVVSVIYLLSLYRVYRDEFKLATN